MRIVHVVPGLSREDSGPSYSVLRLCESLRALGAELILATLDWGGRLPRPDMVRAFPLGYGPRRLGRSPEMWRWLRFAAEGGHVDVLHSHCLWQLVAVYPGWAAAVGEVPLVVSPRGMLSDWTFGYRRKLVKRVFWRALQRRALARAACFHATSENEYREVRKAGFLQPVAILPNGVDLPGLADTLLRPSGRSRDRHRILLFLSRLDPKKGLELLLPAWRAVQHLFPDWRVVIAGSDEGYYGKTGYARQVRNRAQELGLNRVSFVGELTGEAKWNAYLSADLYILPTLSENFGLTVAEALAAGTPVITTTAAPWAGLREHGAGWWVQPTVEALADSLKDALSRSREELAEMGLRGREWVEREFSWSAVAGRMCVTYEWLRGAMASAPPWVRLD